MSSDITDLTTLAAGSVSPTGDWIPIVDVSDTTMAASGTTKKVAANSLFNQNLGTAGTPTFARVNQNRNSTTAVTNDYSLRGAVTITSTDGGVQELLETGINSAVVFGSGGTATVGTAHAFTGQIYVRGSGNSTNEPCLLMGVINCEIGTGFTQTVGPTARLWGTDFAMQGPVAVQPTILSGINQVINNYYNGSPSAAPATGMCLVTKPNTGGFRAAGHTSVNTYPVDVGIAVVGFSNAGAGNQIGFTTAIKVGGFAGPWMESGTSICGIGADIQGYKTAGVKIHTPGDTAVPGLLMSGVFAQYTEMTAPGTQPADTAAIYAADDGTGNTRLFQKVGAIATALGGRVVVQVLTAGTTTYTPTSGMRWVLAFAQGGGAGGRSGVNTDEVGGGGGAGGCAIKLFAASDIGTSKPCVVGAVAANDAAGNTTGLGTTNSLLQATGGAVGTVGTGTTAFVNGAGGAGGVGTLGDLNMTGGAGFPGFIGDTTNGFGGPGGTSFFGGGGRSGGPDTAGGGGGAYGGGGAGGHASGAPDRVGGGGAAGVLFMLEFI